MYQAGYDDEDAFARAVDGVDTVFLVSLPESDERRAYQHRAIEACRKAGVRRIVYTSFIHAAPDATFTFAQDHYDTEQALEASGIPFVALRNNLYTDVLPYFATDGVIRGPGGKGKFAPVARTDIAAVAAAVMSGDDYETRRLDVTGPQLVDLYEIAQVLSDITGQSIRYHEETVEEAYESRAVFNPTKVEIDGWVTSYTAIAVGEMATVSDTVERITGQPAIAPATYLRQLLGA